MLRLYEDVMNKGDLGAIDEILAGDFVEHEELPSRDADRQGGPAGADVHDARRLPRFPLTVEEMLQDGDKVITRARFSGTHKGEFMGMRPTNNRFDIPLIDIVEFRDDKAIAHWGVMDTARMMEQLGIGGPPA